ncbi:MAG: hypothetical protein IT548_04495 [Alphaproteobacteria bacterium]|nr:hypothetical protein [Alphaproteobacteria bacterium]
MTNLLSSYISAVRAIDANDLGDRLSFPENLIMDRDVSVGLTIAYAPFDYVNDQAKIVIVGITPGLQQATNALQEAKRKLDAGEGVDAASRAAKTFASFSGAMRSSLVAMLDMVGINRYLGIASCSALWNERTDLAHWTSALRYPVFANGRDYAGEPNMLKSALLQRHLKMYTGEELRRLPNAVLIPVGTAAASALEYLGRLNFVDPALIFSGLPHPSGANAERIAYFLGRKAREALSIKTVGSASKLDQARVVLQQRVVALMA